MALVLKHLRDIRTRSPESWKISSVDSLSSFATAYLGHHILDGTRASGIVVLLCSRDACLCRK